MTIEQFCKEKNLDKTILEFCLFAVSKGEEHVEFLFSCLQKDVLDKYLRIVVGNDIGNGFIVRPEIKELVLETSSNSNKFTKLIQTMAVDKEFTEIELSQGYLYSPKMDRECAMQTYNSSNFTIEKSIKVLKYYYNSKNSDINLKGLYSLICSPTFGALYHSYKEEEESFWK